VWIIDPGAAPPQASRARQSWATERAVVDRKRADALRRMEAAHVPVHASAQASGICICIGIDAPSSK